MRTLFLCHELALQIEGFDTHDYRVEERVHVRYRDRLVSLIVESVTHNGLVREISMRPLSPLEQLRGQPVTRIPEGPPPVDPKWVDDFCEAIEGSKGPVSWTGRSPSR